MAKNKKPTCKTGLKKNIISKKVFERELALCRELGKKCNWGKCENCGVIPLLFKLHKGKLLENPEEIKKTRNKILN